MPKKTKECKYRVGDFVYVNSLQFTKTRFVLTYESQKMLGHFYPIDAIHATPAYIPIKYYSLSLRKGNSTVRFDERDVGWSRTPQITEVDNLPSYMREIENLQFSNGIMNECHYVLYKSSPRLVKERKELSGVRFWKFLRNQIQQGNEIGAISNNSACWAGVMRQWNDIYNEHEEHPDTIMVKVRSEDLSDEHYEEIIPFWKAMKRSSCLPKSTRMPRTISLSHDNFVSFKTTKLTKEQLFWYLNIIRYAQENIGVMIITNHLIKKGKMEPLMALVLAHVCLPGFYGGHAVINDPEYFRVQDTHDGIIPNIKKVVRYVLKCHKFLTKNSSPTIISNTNYLRNRWNLTSTLDDQGVRFTQPPELTMQTVHRFQPTTRKLSEGD